MNPIRWVPSLYFVQGLQFFVVMLIAGLMYKNMGVDNATIARWTGLLGLAWALKPLWSPLIELVASKKRVVVVAQFTGALGLGLMALALQAPAWFALSIAVFFVLAYASATHDIACDGLYMASLDAKQQAAYAGWQGAFFNASKFLTLGGLLILAGWLERRQGVMNAWSLIFLMLAVLLAALAAWNARVLPPALGQPPARAELWANFMEVLLDFLKKPGIGQAFLFIVLFRFAEGQVQTIGPLFLIEARDKGGLGLTTEQVGGIYGTVGTAAFLVGSILGGYFTAALGLRRAMPVLLLAMMLPNAVFYGLARLLPSDLWSISAAITVEMAGYGFGFVGMILYIMQVVAPGRFNTAHYALGSGVMQLGFIFSKTLSGDIQQALGYQAFFAWTLWAGLPALLLWIWVRRSAPAPAAQPA
ncbi:PAT family beta-lactamase induction signal transducer AmpG [Inhella inkyongensis]|uniref:PAT family beta-lactamase induction signal transducer AmpG n=1 Tax=Inhella inkyongensis TaxID=392593 RepID=A0A840SA31_9BURK|nr:MFS transporter [Inhella inkyongensis]MBB5205634.1 PAT family beta-lactamase induction signal transducer AmpG [Inhella inkyongensis]